MKVYRPESMGKTFTVFIQPGREHPETSAWIKADGTPESFSIKFVDGFWEGDSQIAKYLLDKKMCQKSPIILPRGVQI